MRSLTVTLLYCMPYGTAKTAVGENVGTGVGPVGTVVGTGVGLVVGAGVGLVVGTGVGIAVGIGVGIAVGTGAIVGDLMSENNPAKEREQ